MELLKELLETKKDTIMDKQRIRELAGLNEKIDKQRGAIKKHKIKLAKKLEKVVKLLNQKKIPAEELVNRMIGEFSTPTPILKIDLDRLEAALLGKLDVRKGN